MEEITKTPKEIFNEAVEQTRMKRKVEEILGEQQREINKKEFWKFVELEEAG